MKALDRWIRVVQSAGTEVSVTVLVSGVLITGFLTPWARYTSWSQEVAMRAMHEGGTHPLPDAAMGPISEHMTARVRAEWDAEVQEAGVDPDDYWPAFEQFALRDVEIRAGMKMYWPQVPYLVVSVSEVAAFMPGTIGQPHIGP